MFLENYHKQQAMYHDGITSTSFVTTTGKSVTGYGEPITSSAIGSKKTLRIRSIRTETLNTNSTGYIHSGNETSYPYFGVFLGTGTTPPTFYDYTLESPITSGLSSLYMNTAKYKEAPGIWVVSTVYTIRNISDAEINISEIGLIVPVKTTSASSGITWESVLMERTVLDEPINIQPGEVKSVTYKFTFNHNVA